MGKKRQKNWTAIIIILVVMVVVVASIFLIFTKQDSSEDSGYQIPNPAKTYCEKEGYQYKIKNTDKGEQGFCLFPDKTECDSWSYFCGCTNDQRYCSKTYSSCLYECK